MSSIDRTASKSPSSSTGKGKKLMNSGGRAGKTLSPSSASTAASVAKKKKKTLNSDQYTTYIFKLLRQERPQVKITQKAMAIMNSFVNDAFERIASEAAKLCVYAKKDTLSANEVRTAVRLVLPGELAKHANHQGMQAVEQYTLELGSSPKHRN